MPGKYKHGGSRRQYKKERRTGFDVQKIWGLHSVEAALLNPRREHIRLFATENAWRRLEHAGGIKIRPEIVRPQAIDKLLHADAVHQGVLLEARPLAPLALEDVPAEGCVLALDQVTDPHNVGAILRTAAAFGVKALIMTERYSPDATGTLAKAASGALEYVPLVVVKNLRTALDELQRKAFSAVGLDSESENDFATIAPNFPLILVLGAEGRGLRHGIREACDYVARLDLPGSIKSLNVSNAAAVALYAVSQKNVKR